MFLLLLLGSSVIAVARSSVRGLDLNKDLAHSLDIQAMFVFVDTIVGEILVSCNGFSHTMEWEVYLQLYIFFVCLNDHS